VVWIMEMVRLCKKQVKPSCACGVPAGHRGSTSAAHAVLTSPPSSRAAPATRTGPWGSTSSILGS
jgi:hypothetical protein